MGRWVGCEAGRGAGAAVVAVLGCPVMAVWRRASWAAKVDCVCNRLRSFNRRTTLKAAYHSGPGVCSSGSFICLDCNCLRGMIGNAG